MKIVITKKGSFEMFFKAKRFLMHKHHLDIQGSGHIHKTFGFSNMEELQARELSDFIYKNILQHNCLLIDYDEREKGRTSYLNLKFRNYEEGFIAEHIFFFESDECKS